MKTPATFMAALLLAMASDLPAHDEAPALFEVTTLSGEVYKDSRVIKVTPADLTVMHQGGVAKIPFEKLNADWQKKFDYDPAKAAEYQRIQLAIQRDAEAERLEQNARRERSERETMARLEANEQRRARANDPAPSLIPFPGEEAKAAFDAQSNFSTAEHEEIIPNLAPLGPVHDPSARFGRVRSDRWGYSYGDGIYSETYSPPYIWYGGHQYHHPRPSYPVYHGHHHHHHHGSSGIQMGPTTIRITR